MPEGDPSRGGGVAFEKAMELWVASPSKVRLAVFFRHNPGLVDTLEGLAARLAMAPQDLAPEIRDHLQLGILRERKLGDTKVYAFDRGKADEIMRMIEDAIAGREAFKR